MRWAIHRLLVTLAIAFVFGKGQLAAGHAALAWPEVGQLSASHLFYQEASLLLEGNVQATHALGKLSADRMELFFDGTAEGAHIARSVLEGDVKLFSSDGRTRLYCQKATYEAATHQLTCHGKEHLPVLVIQELAAERSFEARGQALRLWLDPEEPSEGSFPTFQLVGDLLLSWQLEGGQQLRLHGHALTNCDEELRPTVGWYCTAAPGESCWLFADQRQAIGCATELLFFPMEERLVAYELQGWLWREGSAEPLRCASEAAVWSQERGELQLLGETLLQESGGGQLFCKGEISLYGFERLEGGAVWPLLSGSGLLLCQQPAPLLAELFCHGQFETEAAPPRLCLKSLRPEKISYLQGPFELYGDRLQLEWFPSPLELKKLVVKGDVEGVHWTAEGEPQTLLAGMAEYCPKEQLLLLSSWASQPVVYEEPAQGLRATAPRLLLQQEPLSQRLRIQGGGHVCFTFRRTPAGGLPQLLPTPPP